MSREHAGRFIGVLSLFGVVPSGYELMRQACRIHDATRFGWWDCTLIASAPLAVGKYFREDPQHERQPEDVTIFRSGLIRSSNCSE
jgi:predicted nucleic acid-binding protein